MNTYNALLNIALWLAGIGNFCVLGASLQAPARLGWREDVAKLKPFNRKIFWVYGVFIVLTIIAFGTLTLALHAELMRGDRAAVGLAAFIAVFWSTRVAIDFFVYDHADWPPGKQFVIGHILLTGLFIALAVAYWGVVVRSLMGW